jgi:hypothetical protein
MSDPLLIHSQPEEHEAHLARRLEGDFNRVSVQLMHICLVCG